MLYDGRHNFAIFDVDGDTLSVQVWSTNAGNTNAAEVIDQFTMTKSSAMCGTTGDPDAGPVTSDAGNTPTDDASAPGANDASNNDGAGSGGCCQAGNGDAETFDLISLVGWLLIVRRRLVPPDQPVRLLSR